MNSRFLDVLFGGSERLKFWAVFALVTLVLAGSSYWVIAFVADQVAVEDEVAMASAESLIYVNFQNNSDDYISAEAYITMAEYVQQNEETINVQVLTGLTPNEIIGYMRNHFVSGLGVGCVYCHNLQDYSADVWDDEVAMQNKATARAHAQMSGELNQQWLTQLVDLTEEKQPYGAQISCATCHAGQAQPQSWPEDQGSLPDDFRLPLDETLSADEIDILNVNARRDISLDTVQYQQYVMYHMNTSMNVGCTHCHNSRYFPSWEVPAKYYAQNMLQMNQYIWQNWSEEWLGGQQPSCTLCHQGAVIPPGAVRSVELMPAAISSMPDQ